MIPKVWVVDTNVLVPGLITPNPHSPTQRIVSLMLNGKLRFLLSEELLAEYSKLLHEPRIIELAGFTEDELGDLLHLTVTMGVMVETGSASGGAPDPKDDHLWRLLNAYEKAGLITGDKALLAEPPSGVPVLSARDWLDRFEVFQ